MASNPYETPTEVGKSALTRLEKSARGETPRRGIMIGVAAMVLACAFPLWTIKMAAGINTFILVVALWAACPYLVICLTASRITTLAAKILLGFALFAMAAFGVWAFDKVDEDAQGGLVLVFAPAYQFIAAILAAIIVLLVDKLCVRRAVDS